MYHVNTSRTFSQLPVLPLRRAPVVPKCLDGDVSLNDLCVMSS